MLLVLHSGCQLMSAVQLLTAQQLFSLVVSSGKLVFNWPVVSDSSDWSSELLLYIKSGFMICMIIYCEDSISVMLHIFYLGATVSYFPIVLYYSCKYYFLYNKMCIQLKLNWLIHSLFSIPLTLDMLTFRLDEVPIYSNVQKNKHILKSVQFVAGSLLVSRAWNDFTRCRNKDITSREHYK